MSDVKITVGGLFEDEAARRFADAGLLWRGSFLRRRGGVRGS